MKHMDAEIGISIDRLIDIVKRGGTAKTGVDVYSTWGALLLEKNVLVKDVRALEVVKEAGVARVPIDALGRGGVWDQNGAHIPLPVLKAVRASAAPFTSIEKKIEEICEIKAQAVEKHARAKGCIKKVLDDIQETGGEFDYRAVEGVVTELVDFISLHENGFSYLTREIFSYDDYLYNHSINVCTIATAALQKFNRSFSNAINMFLGGLSFENMVFGKGIPQEAFLLFNDEEIRHITLGFFLHDVGKVAIPDKILNKKGPLDREERSLVKRHSYDKGQEILEKNNIQDPFVKNIVRYHHCTVYSGEAHCYPEDLPPAQVPTYVKVCKLADMYDAMTSRRCYKEAVNPISVVTDLFRQYANKDRLLQFILDSFVRTVGIYPPGSVIQLQNRQKAYILDSEGPIVIPFTDREGRSFRVMQDPISIKEAEEKDPGFGIDRRSKLVSPAEAYEALPAYLKEPPRFAAAMG